MPEDWVTDLVTAVSEAVDEPYAETVIKVPNAERKELAERALERLAPFCSRVTVEVISDGE